MAEMTYVIDARAELGESTLWDPIADVLWWIDIWSKHIHRYNPATGENNTWNTLEYPGCIGPLAKGRLFA